MKSEKTAKMVDHGGSLVVERLRGLASHMCAHGSWIDSKSVQLKKKERDCRKEMESAAAELERVRLSHERAVNDWRSVHAELEELTLCRWMEEMKNSLSEILSGFADVFGDVGRMSEVCQSFIKFFSDSARWLPLYRTCEADRRDIHFPSKFFYMFRREMLQAWNCLESFTTAVEVREAAIAMDALFACWLSGISFSCVEHYKTPLDYIRTRRDEFARALSTLGDRLQPPKTFFVPMVEGPADLTKERGTPSDRPASEAFVAGEMRKLKRHIVKRTRKINGKPDIKPGPNRTETHADDLRRVHAYVKDGFTLSKACDVVAAENADMPDRGAHYAGAGSMRGEYPKWLDEMRRAGKRV